MTLRSATVWRAELLAKLTLWHVPVPRSTWRRFGLLKLGFMTAPSYALATFEKNVGRRWVSAQSRGDDRRPVFEPVLDDRTSPLDLRGLRLLELGPGELLSSAVIAYAGGAESMTLVDAGPYALPELDRYRELAALLRRRWRCEVDAGDAGTLHEILTRCRARYLTDGLESLRRLPAASVDVAWSHAMLEHVREAELLPLLRELRRVLHPTGSRRTRSTCRTTSTTRSTTFGSRDASGSRVPSPDRAATRTGSASPACSSCSRRRDSRRSS